MIKMTLGELVIAEQEGALVEIAKLDLKIKDAIKLTKVLKKVTEELKIDRSGRSGNRLGSESVNGRLNADI